MRLVVLTLLAGFSGAVGGCGGDSSQHREDDSKGGSALTPESASAALRQAGFRVSRSPVAAGSGITGVLFVDVDTSTRVEVATFATSEDADEYRRGVGATGGDIVGVRNALILGGEGMASDADRVRIEAALREG